LRAPLRDHSLPVASQRFENAMSLTNETRMIVFPGDPLCRVEGRDGIVESRDVADVRPQASVPCPLDDLTQLVPLLQDSENTEAIEP
jgi:hypothetical protein